MPQFAAGEIIVKFKKGSSPRASVPSGVSSFALDPTSLSPSVSSLLTSQKVLKIEKVFKNFQSPADELGKFKSRLSASLNKSPLTIDDSAILSIDLSSIYRLEIDKSIDLQTAITAFKADPSIEFAEPNYTYSLTSSGPDDPYFQDSYPSATSARDPSYNPPHDYQWNIKKTNSTNNWQTDTSSVIAAVIDTGVDVAHAELGNVWVNKNEIPGDGIDNDGNGCVDDIHGCDTSPFTITPNGAVEDFADHGTHIAGVISAKTNNSTGIAGVTNNTQIMAVRVFDINGYANEVSVSNGILYAVNNGAQVLNMSIGGSESSLIRNALDYAVAHNVIPVVAASNGNVYSPRAYPAGYKDAITVGAVDENLDKLNYAGYGYNIDVVAPGGGKPCTFWAKPSYCENILSLKSSQNTNDQELVIGGKYLRYSGTSMATPHVVGVISLLLAQHPSFTLRDVENYIRFNSINPLGTVHTEKLGWGVINSTGTDFVAPTNIDFEIQTPEENALVWDTIAVLGTIKADNFDHFDVKYKLKSQSDWATTGVTLVGGGTAQILPQYNLPSQIATIKLSDTAPRGDYEVKITLFLKNGKTLSELKSVHFLQKEGTKYANYSPYADILIADLNNDGQKEIIQFQNQMSPLAVFDSHFNKLWEVAKYGEAVVGHFDRRLSGKQVAIQTKNSVEIYDSQGHLIPDMAITLPFSQQYMYYNLLAADANKDGIDELYFAVNNGIQSNSYSLSSYEQGADAIFRQKWNIPSSRTMRDRSNVYNASAPLAGDINGDGKPEIIHADLNGNLQALNYDGSVVASFVLNANYPLDGMVLADFDKDSHDEIALHVQWGDTMLLKLVNPSDTLLTKAWGVNTSNNNVGMAVGDFNNDGSLDIYTHLSPASHEYIIDAKGTVLLNDWDPVYPTNGERGAAVLADTDNNRLLSVFNVGNYNVDSRQYFFPQEYNYQTSTMQYESEGWKVISGALENDSVAVVDIDNNGKLDVIFPGVGMIEYPTSGTSIWPHKYHDYKRTGSYSFVSDVLVPPIKKVYIPVVNTR